MTQFRIASVCIAVIVMFSGCARFDSNYETLETPDDWQRIDTYIRFIHPATSEPEKKLAEIFKERMENKYPNLIIEYIFLPWFEMEEAIAKMMQSGDSPDLALTQNFTTLAHNGLLENLEPYMNRDTPIWHDDDFLAGTLEYSTVDDQIFAIPNLTNAFSLIVNVSMLEETGMQLEDLKTWSDLEKAAGLMTKNGKYGFGYPLGVARFAFRGPFTAAYSNDLVLDDTSAASRRKYIETLEHFKRLEPYQPPSHFKWGYPEMFRAFSLGEVGIIPAGTFFSAGAYTINPDIIQHTRAIAYPAGPSSTKPQTPVSSVGISMFKQSRNKEMAWRLIEEWAAPEFNAVMAATVNVTALKQTPFDDIVQNMEMMYPKAIEGQKVLLRDFMNMIDAHGVPMAKIPGQDEIENVFQTHMLKYLTNKQDAEQTYRSLQQEIESIHQKYHS